MESCLSHTLLSVSFIGGYVEACKVISGENRGNFTIYVSVKLSKDLLYFL